MSRVFDEERTLSEELAGYDNYRRAVAYRLIPPLWQPQERARQRRDMLHSLLMTAVSSLAKPVEALKPPFPREQKTRGARKKHCASGASCFAERLSGEHGMADDRGGKGQRPMGAQLSDVARPLGNACVER